MTDNYSGLERAPGTAAETVPSTVGTDNERQGCVIKCLQGQEGDPIGHAHADPLFDTREHDIEFTDGSIERCS